jgi:hypothetical protein
MSSWGPRTYGDPCGECGFSWSIARSDAEVVVARLPDRLAELLTGASGNERHPELEWSVAGYVAHVGDNLRIWAERVAGITRGGSRNVGGYDENALAHARVYDSLSLPGTLWSLERSVHDWLDAIATAPAGLTMIHAERGELGLGDVVRSNVHDAVHHEWDIKRSL